MEIWKDIEGYDGLYQISDLGRVKSFKYIKERILKPGSNNKGYLFVKLHKKGIGKNSCIHQLVAIHFLNHKPCGWDMVVNHKNFIRTDNRVVNLEIVTQRENANHKHLKSSSQYTGVSRAKNRNSWVADIIINKRKVYLGSFKNEIDAHNAYQNKLKEISQQPLKNK